MFLRALIVEDSEDDAVLLRRELTKAGFELVHRRVESAEAMSNALDAETWDIVLTDYALPRFSGADALRLVRERDAILPVIVISGVTGEDVAVEMMRSGAADYFLKGELSLLASAVKRELQEAERKRKHRQAEEALAASERRLQRVVQGSNDGVWEWPDLAKDELWWSPRFFEMLGYENGAFKPTGDKFLELLHPDDRERVQAEWKQELTESGIFDSEYRLRSRSGKYIWLQARGQRFFDDSGQPICMIGTVRDLTERREVREALEHSQNLLKHAERLAKVGGFEWDIRSGKLSFSEEWLRIHGLSSAPLTLRELLPLAHEEDRPRIQEAMDQASRNGRIYDVEHRINHQETGETRWVHAHGEVVRDASGNALKMYGFSQDITERKAAQAASQKLANELRAYKNVFDAVLSSISDHVYIFDHDMQFLYVSKSAATALGRSVEEIVGRQWPDLGMPSDIMEPFEEQARTALALREHLRDEVCYPTAIGPRHIEYVVSPLEMADGHSALILNVARDVTERKRAEAAREESERFLRTTLDSLSSHIAILDENGMILAVNEAWRAFARCNDGDLDGVCEGADYFGACLKAQSSDAKTASAVVAGIRTILHGEADTFTLEYPCHSPDTERWFVVRAMPFSGSGPRRVVVAHETITERKLTEAKLRQRETELAQVSRVPHARRDCGNAGT